MPPRAHLAIAAAWAVFGIIGFVTGLAGLLPVTFALSVVALIETRLGAYEAACAKREAAHTEEHE